MRFFYRTQAATLIMPVIKAAFLWDVFVLSLALLLSDLSHAWRHSSKTHIIKIGHGNQVRNKPFFQFGQYKLARVFFLGIPLPCHVLPPPKPNTLQGIQKIRIFLYRLLYANTVVFVAYPMQSADFPLFICRYLSC